MKTTSYEISKKLKEAGFEAQSSFFWCRLDKDLIRIHISQSYSVPESFDKIKAYDLETILDALPECIKYKKYRSCREYYLFLQVPTKKLGYYDGCNEYMDHYCMGEEDGIFEVSKLSSNESLADTAGRMWLELKKKNLL